MKLTIPTTQDVHATHIRVVIEFRYGDEDCPFDFPLRIGDRWDILIDIDTGRIQDWPEGYAYELYTKVCDEGSYYLMAGEQVLAASVNDYVVSCIPEEYGDYLNFDIDANGVIADWKKFCTASKVRKAFFAKEE